MLPVLDKPFGDRQSVLQTAQRRISPSTQLIPGCTVYNDYLSCSQIINLCTYSEASATAPECLFFSTYSLNSYLYADASAFSLTPTQGATINFYLVSYSSTGNYIGRKSLVLSDLMRCGTPSNAELGVIFGTTI